MWSDVAVSSGKTTTAAPLIEVAGVGKRYELFDKPADRLKQLLWGRWHHWGRSFWALQDVSFAVNRGEVLGIVGRNGAGKSTLLQLICGTLTPTVGRLSVNGRIAALLELGAGFNPDFSGIENVYLNAALLGLTRNQVDDRLDDILGFADIGAFVHQPVKTYSSGMFVRLAFAVATSLDPDILVVDEALSVGDGAFARKSFDRVMALRDRGVAILFCSHSMYHVQVLCDRALWLEGGRVRLYDKSAKVTAAYETSLVAESAKLIETGAGSISLLTAHGTATTQESPAEFVSFQAGLAGAISHPARILGIDAETDDGQTGRELALRTGETTLQVTLRFASDPALPAPTVAFGVAHLSGVTVSSGLSSKAEAFARDEQGFGTARLVLPKVPLMQGDYFLTVFLACERGLHVYEFVEHALTLRVSQAGLERGLVALPQRWSGVAGADDQSTRPTASQAPVNAIAAPREAGAASWVLVDLGSPESHEVRDLFALVFGHPMSHALWEWKYGAGRGLATGLRGGDRRLLAHYGGTLRAMVGDGQHVTAVQVGDVMVAPEARDVLARMGPFGRVAKFFIDRHLGPAQAHPFGFGFPNARHMRLGQRLGLYWGLDRMLALSWNGAQSCQAPPGWSLAPLDWSATATSQRLTDLDRAMQLQDRDLLRGKRDGAWWQHRFAMHPEPVYTAFWLRHTSLSQPAGALVLKMADDGKPWELMDWVGSHDANVAAVPCALAHSLSMGSSALLLWATPAALASLSDAVCALAASESACEVAVTHPQVLGRPATAWAGHTWLTGGDTDFR